nr:RHS repeat-associated core domain-containing protein [Frankia nepalensis]
MSHTAGPVTTDYTYDGLDQIVTGNSAEDFVYDGLEKEPGVDGTSAYVRGPAGELLGTSTAGGAWATLENQHGDVVAALTIDGTALTDDRSYDPFGVPLDAGDPNLRVGYQGSWTDPDTGLVNALARWYDPATGTFLSRDTAALSWTGTAADNRHTYGGANPVRYSDPTGFDLAVGRSKQSTEQEPRFARYSKDPRYGELTDSQLWEMARLGEDQFWAGIRAYNAGVRSYNSYGDIFGGGSTNGPMIQAENLATKYPNVDADARINMVVYGEDEFLAGVTAYKAYEKALTAKYPDLGHDAIDQMIKIGEDKFWPGVNAKVAYDQARSAATQQALKALHADSIAATSLVVAPPVQKKKDCGLFNPGCAVSGAFKATVGSVTETVVNVTQSAGNWVANNQLVSMCANFVPGTLGVDCGSAQALGHLVNGWYADAAMSAAGVVVPAVGGIVLAKGGGAVIKALNKADCNSFTLETRSCSPMAPPSRWPRLTWAIRF